MGEGWKSGGGWAGSVSIERPPLHAGTQDDTKATKLTKITKGKP